MPHYVPSSVYTMNLIEMADRASSLSRVYFRHPGHGLRQEDSIVDEDSPQIELVTDNPDTEPLELDVENISIDAEPTKPDNPDGETLVTLRYSLRDNISGAHDTAISLRDPQGIGHFFWDTAQTEANCSRRVTPHSGPTVLLLCSCRPDPRPGPGVLRI